MKMIKKFISLFTILILITAAYSTAVLAEDTSLTTDISETEAVSDLPETESVESQTEVVDSLNTDTYIEPDPVPEVLDTTNSKYNEFVAKVEAYASTGYDCVVVYTPDSIVSEGVLLEPRVDTLKLEISIVITPTYSFGKCIYDDPATPTIEGVRVNGEEVTSLVIPVDLDNPKEHVVDVRIVYSDDLTGTLAKIVDGKFDWQMIMDEPLLAFQALYYAIAAVSLVVSGFSILFSKKKKVKTADDIANAVDSHVKDGCDTLSIQYSDLLKENFLPVLTQVVDTNKAVVKAIALSTSKNKEAPVALLDLLKEVSDMNVSTVIDEAQSNVLKNIADTESKRKRIHQALQNIANGTYQEVHNAEEHSQDTETSGETKSIF